MKIIIYKILIAVGVILFVAGLWSTLGQDYHSAKIENEIGASAAKSEIERIDSENIEIIKADGDSILWKADIINNTSDQTIIGITWRVEIYDTLRRRLVDEMYCSQTHYVVIGEDNGGELINIASGKKESVVSCIPNYQGDKYAWRSNYYPRISLYRYKSK
jgi:hypothetical protein